MSITVKVVKVPGPVTEVELNDGATVADALEFSGKSMESGEGATVNGTAATLETTLSSGDRVVIAKGAKGNA